MSLDRGSLVLPLLPDSGDPVVRWSNGPILNINALERGSLTLPLLPDSGDPVVQWSNIKY
jgi:hypothetical protein